MNVTAEDWNGVWSSKSILHKALNFARGLFTKGLYANIFKKYVGRNKTMLEVGCGSSTTSLYIAPHIKEFVGLDVSDEALKLSIFKAKKLGVVNAKFVKGSAFDMPFKNNTFDIVWSQGLLEHFDKPQGIMDESIRVAKKGGIVITSVPSALMYHKWWYVMTRPRFLRALWPWTEQKFYTKKMLAKLIEGKDVSVERVFHYFTYGVLIQILRKK